MTEGIDDADAPAAPGKQLSFRSVRAAVNMKIAGASYAEIAEVLEYTSAAAARQAVEQGIADAYEPKDTASLRRITNARLEGLFQMSWKNAQETRPAVDEWGDEIPGVVERNPEQLAWVRQAADIVGRLNKLHGLDAPTQLQVSPGAIEFEDTVSRLVAVAQRGLPKEADIFGEEIVEAEEIGPEDEVLDGPA